MIYNSLEVPKIKENLDKDILTLTLTGCWNIYYIHLIEDKIQNLEKVSFKKVFIVTNSIINLDTGGVWLIERLTYHLSKNGSKIYFKNPNKNFLNLIKILKKNIITFNKNINKEKKELFFFVFFEKIGRFFFKKKFHYTIEIKTLIFLLKGLFIGNNSKGEIFHSTINQIEKIGIQGILILSITSCIVGAIIAQQSAFQLRPFGAEIFVVNIISILVFRELGVLLTAIIILSKSGSAITSEIASMTMKEEIDALIIMGINPISFLILPRIVALIIVVPFLTIIANFSSLMGAAFTLSIYSDISLNMFFSRIKDDILLSTYFSGLIKAPFIGLTIGIIASCKGIKFHRTSKSLSYRVTSSVVTSIFMIIIIDALFAIIFSMINF